MLVLSGAHVTSSCSDITGRDPNGWKLLGIYYCGVFYGDVDDLRAAMKKPDFVRTEKTFVTQSMMTNRTGEILPYDTEAPPILVQTQKRFTVDKKQKYVKWMDFEFYIGFNKDVAVTLYNIKYKGERIFYELGLEEALAHYAGSDPKPSHTTFLDAYYGFGPNVFELVKGYDCPWNSEYLDTSLHMDGNTTTNVDSICLYESDAGFPIQRHTTHRMATVTRNTVFNLRFVSTIGNYDYQFTYSFLLDGSIEVAARASGYIQATYYYGNEDFVPATVKYPWDKKEMKTMKVERSILKTEDDAKINWAANGAAMYNIINKDTPNESGHFATHHMYATKHKDTEKHLTHSANNMDSGKPIIDFSKFFDGESLEQEDLVLWFNVGMHHLPHTGDLPITLISTAQSSVIFSPHNYLLSDPSRQTVQQVELDLMGEKVAVDTYGKKVASCQTPLFVDGDYTDYVGGYTISKMPRVPCENC
ncbi:hypothetical protein CVT24_004383 [Panaeolus cyanescens]|uniref:Amine oxidase n=1 Tax=Panaeolus cyanescens TaxID=181874 RepID=A0A409VA04_9AGAR|nr:hypothetical protein CVT24_004383 [Panaeolus cyanescens]